MPTFRISAAYVTVVILIGACASLRRDHRRAPAASFFNADLAEYVSREKSLNLSCEEFFAWLKKDRPTTVAAALSLVRARRLGYLARYTTLANSLSLHESSPERPRILVFGGDARMVLSFNEGRERRGYERLEVMCFDDVRSEFTFRDVAFPREASPGALFDLPKSLRRAANVESPRFGYRTRDCRDCHGTPARALWDTYLIWPAAIGSINDVGPAFSSPLEKSSAAEAEYARADLVLRSRFKRFGRYELLPPNALDRPNLALGLALAQLNARRIVAELGRIPKLDRRAVGRAFFCVPPDVELREECGTFRFRDSVSAEVIAMARNSLSYHRYKYHQLRSNLGVDFDLRGPYRACELERPRLLAQLGESDDLGLDRIVPVTLGRLNALSRVLSPFGIDVRNWSLVLHGGYDFDTGISNAFYSDFYEHLERPMVTEFFKGDHVLSDLVDRRRREQYEASDERVLNTFQKICEHFGS